MPSVNDRHHLEKLLGSDLPGEAGHFRYYVSRPGAELSFFTAYAKFTASREAFLQWMTALGAFVRDDPAARPYLPAAWAAEPGLELPWWDPAPETPADSAAKPFGANGWMVAKYERGSVYVVITDTGLAVDD